MHEKRKRATRAAVVYWAVKEKPKAGRRRLLVLQKMRNARAGAIRAKVKHVFRFFKCQFVYRKVRYRGIKKNAAQVFALLALATTCIERDES